jgi:predicted nucleic-acid-binding protein
MTSFRSDTVKKLVDTNVILRYLLKDNELLFKKASSLLEKVKGGEETVVIPESVLAECVYVLLRIYKVERQIISEKFQGLFSYKGVVNPDKKEMVYAITLFGKTQLSIVDCILCARATLNRLELFTFDNELKKIRNSPPFEKPTGSK